ncbi:hypothetical protein NLJ89_g11689 [Agrocybe chaxingu]|uniref:Uncharacterized protein n=1 Tax=Agrocybe chaxingu TaxID=84603 RepID=A0A9W8JRW3_9AGAR|nr:hypothetical protein NLJ89_g11689 [Agrocybe chaxingu]
MGIEEIGTRYALYATARFINVEEDQPSAWGFAALCAPFRSRYKVVEAKKDIHIRRYIAAPELEAPPPSYLNYLVNSSASSSKIDVGKGRIPSDVLSKIQVLASVPQHVNIEDCEIPITLRMRTKDLPAEECKKLQVTHIAVDLLQEEKCRYRPSAAYLSRYPLPSKRRQPPNYPLREPHPVSSIYDVGLFVPPKFSECICRTFSIMPANERGKYKLPNDNYPFAEDAENGPSGSWYTIDTTVPFVQQSPAHADRECIEWAGMPDLRPSLTSPLFTVSHEVTIALTCTYDLEDGGVATENLSFRIPLSFARVAPKLDPVGLRALLFQGVITGTSSSLQTSQLPNIKEPASFTLPAYSQLYDSSGERKVDHSMPLPLYTPRSTPPSGSTPSYSNASSTLSSPSIVDPAPTVAIDSATNYYDDHDSENAPIRHKHAMRPTQQLVFDSEDDSMADEGSDFVPSSPVDP